MMHQETRRLNTTEVVLPQEVHQESATHLPALMPSAPLDWPVERFTQALDRREVNRRALLRWIQSNLQASSILGKSMWSEKISAGWSLTAAPMSVSIHGTGASRPCGSPAQRKSAA